MRISPPSLWFLVHRGRAGRLRCELCEPPSGSSATESRPSSPRCPPCRRDSPVRSHPSRRSAPEGQAKASAVAASPTTRAPSATVQAPPPRSGARYDGVPGCKLPCASEPIWRITPPSGASRRLDLQRVNLATTDPVITSGIRLCGGRQARHQWPPSAFPPPQGAGSAASW